MSLSDQEYLKLCAETWKTLSSSQQAKWQIYAESLGTGLTGYQAFCSVNLKEKPKPHDLEPPPV